MSKMLNTMKAGTNPLGHSFVVIECVHFYKEIPLHDHMLFFFFFLKSESYHMGGEQFGKHKRLD
jgi:hypothetical protein